MAQRRKVENVGSKGHHGERFEVENDVAELREHLRAGGWFEVKPVDPEAGRAVFNSAHVVGVLIDGEPPDA
jgi:hypothetical protein